MYSPMKYLLLVFASFSIFSTTLAQSPTVLFYGNVITSKVEDVLSEEDKKKSKDQTLGEVEIQVFKNDTLTTNIYNRSTGFYSVMLEPENRYQVVFSKDGFISKKFEFNTTNIQVGSDVKSLKLLTDVTLFEKPENADFTAFSKRPVARCTFNQERGRMEWDMDYARQAFDQFLRLAREDAAMSASKE